MGTSVLLGYMTGLQFHLVTHGTCLHSVLAGGPVYGTPYKPHADRTSQMRYVCVNNFGYALKVSVCETLVRIRIKVSV